MVYATLGRKPLEHPVFSLLYSHESCDHLSDFLEKDSPEIDTSTVIQPLLQP